MTKFIVFWVAPALALTCIFLILDRTRIKKRVKEQEEEIKKHLFLAEKTIQSS